MKKIDSKTTHFADKKRIFQLNGNVLSNLAILLLLTISSFACGSNTAVNKPVNTETAVNSSSSSNNVEDKQARFESDLQTMRTADLKYIFVIRRNDNAVFDAEDKKYLRTNLPTTNRVILSDEEKAFIVGTNYPFPAENMEVLRLRFRVDDFSSAEEKK